MWSPQAYITSSMGAELHNDVRNRFLLIIEACETYKKLIYDDIKTSWNAKHSQALRLIAAVVITTLVAFVLIVFLIVILATRILDPLKRLARESLRGAQTKNPGDELVACAIYQHSQRNTKPFTVINCVAIPDTLLESELFGYEKGAFTGASHRRIGKIEQAQNGTIFLDEIGDMPTHIQAKLLRLLQERSIERLGGRDSIPTDVRIIAATNRNLEKAIDEGRFREDIYYRLKVVTVWVPPLRERKEDIPLLAEYIMTRYAGELGIKNPGITEKAINFMTSYAWPGNVRELANTLQKALIFNQGLPVDQGDVSQVISEMSIEKDKEANLDDLLKRWVRQKLKVKGDKDLFGSCIDYFSSVIVSEALNLTDGNRSQSAKLLGLSRPTLHSKIDKYNLHLKTTVKENLS
ncbi:MAG: sigma-54-dependent Fis family transcriptional regulator [SAR324 cluster bacterium]|nr:sigma-54-dependent Fis family transcriptional regulator [SAR324 cluster bacterium]